MGWRVCCVHLLASTAEDDSAAVTGGDVVVFWLPSLGALSISVADEPLPADSLPVDSLPVELFEGVAGCVRIVELLGCHAFGI